MSPMERPFILHVISRFMIPVIIMFGLYVQFHGDYTPGGGFQAGVICASAFILYALVLDVEHMLRIIPFSTIKALACIGPLIYGGVGVVTMVLKAEFLNYGAFNPSHPAHGQHWGIITVEIGVGMTVFAVMMLLFVLFTKALNTHKGDKS